MKKHLPNEHWLTVFHWVKQCGNNPNQQFCREEITTHPDYPSLLSTIDFLESGGMDYQAVRADASYFSEFNYPVLAHIKEQGQEYMHIIPTVSSWEEQKEITENWSGIVVYPEKNARWINRENDTYRRNANKNRIISASLASVGLILYILAAFQIGEITINIFGLLSLAGLVISLYMLGTELGFQSQIVKQVCGAVSKGGCEQVLKSRFAKEIFGVTPADASVLYFGAQFVMYLLGGFYLSLLPFIFWFSFTGIIISSWSIYTQAYKLKQWCALCLGVVSILILQVVISLITLSITSEIADQSISAIINGGGLYISFFLLLFLILLPVKQLLRKNGSNQLKLAELKKWKLDAGLFINQWQQEEEVDSSIWQHDLLLGKPYAPLMITVACNPYCGPCAKAHGQLEDILVKFDGKLKVLVRFLCDPQQPGSKINNAVSALLKHASITRNEPEIHGALHDWFTWMDYEKWAAKWHPVSTINVQERLAQHQQWTEQSNIAYTPTFFLNGRRIPGRYGLEDIALILPQLAELMNKDEKKTA